MKIVRLDATPVVLPLRYPMRMANKLIESSANVVVRVEAEDGTVGWGEAAAAPRLTGHTQEMIVAGVDDVRDLVVGADPRDRNRLWELMRAAGTNSSSVAAVDVALHDLAGQALGVPVVDLLGGAVQDQIPVIALVGGSGPEQDLAAARRYHEAGYRWFKMKLGVGPPEEERATLAAMRAEFGEDTVLTGDANTAWDVSRAVEILDGFDGLGLAFVEQPVGADDVAGTVAVAEAVAVPIGVDEGIHGMDDVVAYAGTAVAGVSLKLIKMGGITGVVRGAQLGAQLGLSVNLGGKVAETSISTAAIVHAAAAVSGADWGLSVTHTTAVHDAAVPPFPVVDGMVRVPEAPGLGVAVDEEAVAAIRV